MGRNILEAIDYYMEVEHMSEEEAYMMVDFEFDLYEPEDENNL